MADANQPSVIVFIPPLLRPIAGGAESALVPPGTLGEVIDAIEALHPGLRDGLCNADGIRPELSVSIGDAIVSRGLAEPIEAGLEVHFLPALGGG